MGMDIDKTGQDNGIAQIDNFINIGKRLISSNVPIRYIFVH